MRAASFLPLLMQIRKMRKLQAIGKVSHMLAEAEHFEGMLRGAHHTDGTVYTYPTKRPVVVPIRG